MYGEGRTLRGMFSKIEGSLTASSKSAKKLAANAGCEAWPSSCISASHSVGWKPAACVAHSCEMSPARQNSSGAGPAAGVTCGVSMGTGPDAVLLMSFSSGTGPAAGRSLCNRGTGPNAAAAKELCTRGAGPAGAAAELSKMRLPKNFCMTPAVARELLDPVGGFPGLPERNAAARPIGLAAKSFFDSSFAIAT